MYANGVDAFDLEASAFEFVDEPSQGCRCICSGKNVFIHEKAPDEILVLPAFADPCDLEKENSSIVSKHLVDLVEESAKMPDTDMFRHLEAGDLIVAALGHGDIAVIHAKDLALRFGNTGFAEGGVPPGSLVAAEGDAGGVGGVICGGVLGESTPAATNVKESVIRVDVDLLADDGELVVL